MAKQIDANTENQIRELQALENTMQSVLMQKQAFQLELSEIENASKELSKVKDDVYKIAGNIMIKASKDELIKEIDQKKDLINLRLKTLDNQEKSLNEESEELRKNVLSKIKNN